MQGPGTGDRGGVQAEIQALEPGRGQGARVEGRSASGDRGSGTRAAGPGAGAPRGRGPGSRARGQPEASGGALTSRPARKPAGGGPADGRAEEFAAGGAGGRGRVCSLPLLTSPGEQRLLWTQMGRGIQALRVRRPRAREASRDARGGRRPRTPTPIPPHTAPHPAPSRPVEISVAALEPGGPGVRCARPHRLPAVPSVDAEAELV